MCLAALARSKKGDQLLKMERASWNLPPMTQKYKVCVVVQTEILMEVNQYKCQLFCKTNIFFCPLIDGYTGGLTLRVLANHIVKYPFLSLCATTTKTGPPSQRRAIQTFELHGLYCIFNTRFYCSGCAVQ